MLSHSQERRKAKKSLSFHSAHLTHVTSASQSESACGLQRVHGYLFPYFRYNQCRHKACPECRYLGTETLLAFFKQVLHRALGEWKKKKKRKCTTYESFQIFSGFKETPPRLWSSSTFLNLESSDQSPSLKYEISRYLAVGIGMVV